MPRHATGADERRSPTNRGAWLPVAALVAYVLVAALPHDMPSGSHVPFGAVWAVASALALALARAVVARRRPDAPSLRPVEVLAILAVTAMALTDLRNLWTQPLRDLGIYLKAGEHYLSGAPVYMQREMIVQPADRTNYPFLYPPFTLPVFGALSLLPFPLVAAGWVAGSAALAFAAFRAVGVAPRWALAALLWPPAFEGLYVGNVSVPAFALFAIGPWIGGGLVLGAIFKAYTGIASLWLVRERRLLELAAGLLALGALALATLPLTGTALWTDWIGGLRLYSESQPLVPPLYGAGLPRYVPYPAYLVAAAACILVALRYRGREGLARLGVATVVASPSLFLHGYLLAVPAMLMLDAPWLWLVLGFASTPFGVTHFMIVLAIAASWLLPAMRRRAADVPAPLDPLGANAEPWPDWREERDAAPAPEPGPRPATQHRPLEPRRPKPAD